MRAPSWLALLSGISLLACGGSSRCEAPAGCLRATVVDGACGCREWQVASVEVLPVKYVVLGVVYGLVGGQSAVVYGESFDPAWPGVSSELGSRFRVVVPGTAGAERAAALGRIDTGSRTLLPVTAASAAFRLAGGDSRSGSSDTYHDPGRDIPSHARDAISIWVNPTLTVTTDVRGEVRADWAWTAVGGCYTPFACDGAMVKTLSVEEIDGTIPAWDPYARPFLATLSAAERAEILRYDVFLDPPGRDPATLASDPRLQYLGPAALGPAGASYPTPAWTPCAGTLTDGAFQALGQAEAGPARIEHGVLSTEAACQEQRPGLVMATSTPGCELTASVYLDRRFGSLAFVPSTVSAACTGQ